MTAELPLKYAELPLALIDPSPTNPRRSYDPQEMEELESSIRQHGVMEPLLVRPVGERFEIVCGERRWRASKTAGLDTIPAITRTMDDVLMAELQMVENIARSNLDPLEEAYGVERLIDLGRTREQVATALHRSADWVQLRLDLERSGSALDVGRRVVAMAKFVEHRALGGWSATELAKACQETPAAMSDRVRRECNRIVAAVGGVAQARWQQGPAQRQVSAQAQRGNHNRANSVRKNP